TTTSPPTGLADRPGGGSANPAGEERSTTAPSRLPGSDDQWMPAAAHALALAIAQMAVAVSKPSATTVDSMLALVTHTGVSRIAGSVMLELAGSTVFPFSRAAGGVPPASRIVARTTAACASL